MHAVLRQAGSVIVEPSGFAAALTARTGPSSKVTLIQVFGFIGLAIYKEHCHASLNYKKTRNALTQPGEGLLIC
jgi:hypothetical protein